MFYFCCNLLFSKLVKLSCIILPNYWENRKILPPVFYLGTWDKQFLAPPTGGGSSDTGLFSDPIRATKLGEFCPQRYILQIFHQTCIFQCCFTKNDKKIEKIGNTLIYRLLWCHWDFIMTWHFVWYQIKGRKTAKLIHFGQMSPLSCSWDGNF